MIETINTRLERFRIFDLMNQTVPVLIGIFIFLNPFPHSTAIKEICFYLSVVFVLILVSCKKTEFTIKTPLLIPFGLFVFWTFITLFFALDKSSSIHDFYSHLIRYIILYYIVVNFFCSKKRLFSLSWIIVISTAIFYIWALYLNYVILGIGLSHRFGGTLMEIQINSIGIIVIFSIILCINLISSECNLYRKTLLFLSLFPLSLATLMTQTRSSILAIFLSFSILFYKKKKVLVLLFIVLLLIISVFPVKNRFFNKNFFKNERIKNYFVIFEIIKDHPIVGIGYGMETFDKFINFESYSKKLPHNLQPEILLKYPHCIFIEMASRVGIIGLIIFCYIMFVFIKMCWNSMKNGKEKYIQQWGLFVLSAFTMFFFIGFFEPVFMHMTEVVLFIILSMGTIVWRLSSDDK